jgi:hypothetical protein
LELTRDQLAAAEASGCALVPATDDHVRRLTVQRRIFRIDGKPHLVVRGGYNETHATLAALLERHRGEAPHRATAPSAAAATVKAAPPDASTSGAAPEGHGAEQRHEAAEPVAKVRRPRQPRPRPEARPEVAFIAAPEAAPAETEEMLAAATATASSGGPKARVAGRWRAGQPKTPRWMVAGKLRRGRLR